MSDNKIKITDLEEFVRKHIKNPYMDMIPDGDKIKLKNVHTYIYLYPEWWGYVKSRIDEIGFYFPNYIKHSLLDLIVGVK